MRAGDNASAPAHVGPLQTCARPVPERTASALSMMVASDPPHGVPRHRQGPLYHDHGSFSRADQCRHEGCTALLLQQNGPFCIRHTASSESQRGHQAHIPDPLNADQYGVRRSSFSRNIPIMPSHSRAPTLNGLQNSARANASGHASASSFQNRKTLPEKMVARKSVTTLPFLPGRTDSPSASASPESVFAVARPLKRQRLPSHQDRSIGSDMPSIFARESRPNGPVHDPGEPGSSGPRDRSPDIAEQGANGLRNSSAVSSLSGAPPAWRSPLFGLPRGHSPKNSSLVSQSAMAVRTAQDASSKEAKAAASPLPSQSEDSSRQGSAEQKPHRAVSSHSIVEQTTARFPELSQSESAVTLLAKFKDNSLSVAELKAMLAHQPYPIHNGTKVPGERAVNGTMMNARLGEASRGAEPSHTAAIRPAWRPSVPPINSAQNWHRSPATIDLTRSNTPPDHAATTRPHAISESFHMQVSRSPTTLKGDSSSPRTNGSMSGKTRPSQRPLSAESQRTTASPGSAASTIKTGQSPSRPVGLNSAESRENGIHATASQPSIHQQRPSAQKPLGHVVGRPRSPITRGRSPRTISPSHGSTALVRLRRERQFEAAKRAEDALRQATEQLMAGYSTPFSDETSPLPNGAVNGDHQHDITHSKNGTSTLFFPSGEDRRLLDIPEPERVRLRLVEKHDSERMDGFIYGELNAPCRPASRLFHISPEEHPSRETQPAKHFAHIDPRVHWSRPRSRQWHEETRAEIENRGNKKTRLGKAPARQAQRKREIAASSSAAGSNPRQIQPPERVATDPLWMAALKELDDMAAKYHTEERAKVPSLGKRSSSAQTNAPTKNAAGGGSMGMTNGDGLSSSTTTRRSGRTHNTRQQQSSHNNSSSAAADVSGQADLHTTPTRTTRRRILRPKPGEARSSVTMMDEDDDDDDDGGSGNDEDSTYGGKSGGGVGESGRLRRRGGGAAASRDDHEDHKMADVDSATTTPSRTRR